MPSVLVYLRLKLNWTSCIFTCETGRRPHKTTSTLGDAGPLWAVVLSIVPNLCGRPMEGPPSLCCRERGGNLMPLGPWWGWWHPGSRGVREGAEVWDNPSELSLEREAAARGRKLLCSPEAGRGGCPEPAGRESTLLRAPAPSMDSSFCKLRAQGQVGLSLRMSPHQVQRGLCLPEQLANPGKRPAALRTPSPLLCHPRADSQGLPTAALRTSRRCPHTDQ